MKGSLLCTHRNNFYLVAWQFCTFSWNYKILFPHLSSSKLYSSFLYTFLPSWWEGLYVANTHIPIHTTLNHLLFLLVVSSTFNPTFQRTYHIVSYYIKIISFHVCHHETDSIKGRQRANKSSSVRQPLLLALPGHTEMFCICMGKE